MSAGRLQRSVMGTEAEWERIDRAAAARGMDRSRYMVWSALRTDAVAEEVQRRALREALVLSLLEQKRLRQAGRGRMWDEACEAVDEWIGREGSLERLTDPGAANRWKAVGLPEDGDEDGAGPEQAGA